MTLEENREYEFAPLIKDNLLKITRQIEIVENGGLVFELDGDSVKSVQLINAEYAKSIKEEGAFQVVSSQSSVQCFMVNGILKIFNNTIRGMDGKDYFLTLDIKNPKIGANRLTCQKESNNQNFGSGMKITNTDGKFTATNLEIKRTRDCNKTELCHEFWVQIDQFDNKAGGMVSGTFSGAVFEDGEVQKDACVSSKYHGLSGEFWLNIQYISK